MLASGDALSVRDRLTSSNAKAGGAAAHGGRLARSARDGRRGLLLLLLLAFVFLFACALVALLFATGALRASQMPPSPTAHLARAYASKGRVSR